MKKTPFVWLGANRARKWPVGQKALLLDKATSAGLPVPNGAILLDELFQIFIEEGSLVVTETAVSVTDPDWLFESFYQGIRFPRIDQPAAMRSAFSVLDNSQQPIQSIAKLDVDLNDPNELAAALSSVWSVSSLPKQPFRRDVLVMEMVGGTDMVEGTAVIVNDTATDQISTQEGSLEIPQLTGFFPRTDSSLPPYAQRLQKLLRGIRRTFGEGSWQVDWLDDGEICWVTKVVERKPQIAI
jgi:hypothetical protein